MKICRTKRNGSKRSTIRIPGKLLHNCQNLAVINQVVFQFLQMGLVIDGGSNAAVLIYTICWSHVAVIAVALAYMAIWAFRNAASANTTVNSQGIASLAVFWYAIVVAYQVIWIAIFVTR